MPKFKWIWQASCGLCGYKSDWHGNRTARLIARWHSLTKHPFGHMTVSCMEDLRHTEEVHLVQCLNHLINQGEAARGRRETLLLDYVNHHPDVPAMELAKRFGFRDHQAVTGVLRENGVKRPTTGSPLADAAREAGAEVKVVDLPGMETGNGN